MNKLSGITLTLALTTLVQGQGIGGSLNVTDSATEIREQLPRHRGRSELTQLEYAKPLESGPLSQDRVCSGPASI